MKKLYATIGLFLATLLSAQVPQAFSYQTIAFNASGAPIANGNVALKISILESSATGTVLYTETHTKTTNSKGLVNLNIGEGTATTGTFGGINWGANTKFVKVEMDPAGGSNYTNVGVNQLMSVPYALVAENINTNSPNSTLNDDFVENQSTNYAFGDNIEHKVHAFSSKTGNWSTKTYNINITNVPTIVSSVGNFIFGDYIEDKVHAFSAKTGTWTTQTYNINLSNVPTITSSNGSFVFGDNIEHKIHAFNPKSGTWKTQNYNINISNVPTIIVSNGNFAFGDNIAHKVYVFSSKTGLWTEQAFNINITNVPTISAANGNFIFGDPIEHKIHVFNSKSGTWSSQNYNINISNTPSITTSETN